MKGLLCGIFIRASSASETVMPFLIQEVVWTGGHLDEGEFMFCFQEDGAGQRAHSVALLFLTCLQLKIIVMSEWHIWAWQILLPYRPLPRLIQGDSGSFSVAF